ncbi:TPR repeat-containing protein, partial [Colletotrichum sp. SAR 10_75]
MAESQQAPVSLLSKVAEGAYVDVLTSSAAKDVIARFASSLAQTSEQQPPSGSLPEDEIAVGLAALNAFLQSNVTGPVLENVERVEKLFIEALAAADTSAAEDTLKVLRRKSFKELEVDGVSPYPYIPSIELFALARHIFTASTSPEDVVTLSDATRLSVPWTRLRINVWHFKLLSQPSLGPGSNFAKASQWIDVPTLAEQITAGLEGVRKQLLDEDVWATGESAAWSREEKVQFLLEAANTHIMLGRDDKAREALKEATQLNSFAYALSGALGKRTKFQEKSTSQLVVLAKSDVPEEVAEEEKTGPEAVALNDDTLLEEIQFSKDATGKHGELAAAPSALPAALADVSPDAQPRLSPLDQIILLTEATLKDTFSPVDTLTSEEVLPYAVRVVSDKPTNWQIYTQALLVRSRIEVHRSRTVERGVLQMQAVVDQVVVDTSEAPRPKAEDVADVDVPAIAVTSPDTTTTTTAPQKPTSFFPAAKDTDTAPAHVRLQYIHALSSPPRWHLESELAYSWAGVGSLVSALEIFKRLRLWAEVALCLASSASADDEDGRGSGGEQKARAIVRWRLFHKTGTPAAVEHADPDTELEDGEDVTYLKPDAFQGPERVPPPPNAPRLFCILGDLENEPAHWERAWDVSKHRFARAQKSLGEHWLQQKDWTKALEAYQAATRCNRLSPELWGRLGDISLRMGNFADAAEAYGRAIGAAGEVVGGEDARTWSNLGSSLWSMYLETVEDLKKKMLDEKNKADEDDDEETEVEHAQSDVKDPATLLSQALAAYKRGAQIAQENWRIWDNVLTLASRMRPPAVLDMVLALRAIMRIRKTEDALDDDVLRALLSEALLTKQKAEDDGHGVYTPPRGTVERAVVALFEESVVPLITTRSELWGLVVKLR